MGDDVYRRENHTFRDAGRGLSDVRDAQVIRETLDELTTRYGDEVPDRAFDGLRARLDAEAQAAHERVSDDATATDELAGTLDAARARVAAWPLPEDGDWSILAPGFDRIYRRGGRALRAARRDPSTEKLP